MSEVNLPHDHGQNIEKVLERMPDTDECVVVAEVFKQISDGSRIRILWLLCHCEECVSNIAAAMNMSDPAVSHHLMYRPAQPVSRGKLPDIPGRSHG